jgi:hypothetical protein
MNIRAGIVGRSDGWATLLRQEGAPYAAVQGDLTPDAFSVVVVNDFLDDRDIAMLRQYMRLGGAMLCSAKAYAAIRGTTRDRRTIKYLLPGPGSMFRHAGLVDIDQEAFIAWNANELPMDDGTPTAFVGTYEGGHVIALPVDPSELVRVDAAARRSFFSPHQRLPFERVSAVCKNGMRRIMRTALEHLHAARGVPYVHRWHFPGAAPSVFGIRIDTDRASSGEVEHLYEHMRAKQVPATWFVDVKAQEQFLWRFKQMQGQEIGIHCFEHRTFSDDRRNHENILKARHLFREGQLGCEGFAAPYGIWNSGLGKVVREFRFEYSSEFSWDYDNLPSEPWLDDGSRGIPQIPVHPIAAGTLRRQGYEPEAMKAYFRHVIDEKLSRREPMLFYHHPKDANEQVLDTIIHAAEGANLPFMCLRDWSRWWRSRSEYMPHVRLQEETIVIDGGPPPGGVMLRVLRGDGQEAFIETDGKTRLDGLDWGRPPEPSSIPKDIARIRSFNVRIPLTLAVDAVTSIRRR